MPSYEPIYDKNKNIIGYAYIYIDRGRQVPKKPNLDELDKTFDIDANHKDSSDDE